MTQAQRFITDNTRLDDDGDGVMNDVSGEYFETEKQCFIVFDDGSVLSRLRGVFPRRWVEFDTRHMRRKIEDTLRKSGVKMCLKTAQFLGMI